MADSPSMQPGPGQEIALLGGGCFWCLEAAYSSVAGVDGVVSGYAGGARPHPTYEQVCTGATGHAEVVQILFRPAILGYRDLLDIYFAIHDPTTVDRQGNDVGSQYRSVIFHIGEAQRETALATIRALEADDLWDDPIVTQVLPAPVFYPAEAYHQAYYANHPGQGYCRVVISPKLAKLRAKFASRLKDGTAQR